MNRPWPIQITQVLCLLGVITVVHVVNFVMGYWFTRFGVIPRSLVGLRGVLFSPLLHKDWSHLFANLVPLGVMLGLLGFIRGALLWPVVGAIWIGSGIAVWLVGRPGSIQVGASGLIYGVAAFLVTYAWHQRDVKSGLAALVVVFLYGGIVWGLLPGKPGISWEGHLAGAVAGVLVAIFLTFRWGAS